MAVKSIYIPDPAFQDQRLVVDGEEHQHLRVGRVETGEIVELFDGRGQVWQGSVLSCERRETVLRIHEARTIGPVVPNIILGLSLVKSDPFELALEKAVEVGVSRIVPLIASRTNLSPGQRSEGRRERWNRILIEAAKQSKRYWIPLLDSPCTFADALGLAASTKIVFAERGGGPLESALSRDPVLCLVGPEGGWTAEELAAAGTAGFRAVGLGDGILRTETAAIVGVALIHYEFHRNR